MISREAIEWTRTQHLRSDMTVGGQIGNILDLAIMAHDLLGVVMLAEELYLDDYDTKVAFERMLAAFRARWPGVLEGK